MSSRLAAVVIGVNRLADPANSIDKEGNALSV